MERVLYKCRKNTHALLLLMAALLFVRMSDNVNVAAAARKMKTEDVDVNNDDNSPVPAAPPSESEPAPALAPEPEPEPAPAPSEPAPALAPEPQPQPATTTVTFFMHDVVGGSNPTAKPLSMSGGSTTLINPNGLIPPITSGGGLLNGGPLPLTFPSAAIPQSPLLNTQFPATSVNRNGFISSGNPSFLNGVGPTIPTATGAGLLNPLLQNGPVLPLTFPNGFVPSSSTNPLLNGIGINGQNLQFNQFPAALNFPFTSQQGIPLVNSGEDNTALPEREIAVVGGSGKFQGAIGHAVMETVSNTADETVLKFIVNPTY